MVGIAKLFGSRHSWAKGHAKAIRITSKHWHGKPDNNCEHRDSCDYYSLRSDWHGNTFLSVGRQRSISVLLKA